MVLSKFNNLFILDYTAKRTSEALNEALTYCSMSIYKDGSENVAEWISTPFSIEVNRHLQLYMLKEEIESAWIGIIAMNHTPRWIIEYEGQFFRLDLTM